MFRSTTIKAAVVITSCVAFVSYGMWGVFLTHPPQLSRSRILPSDIFNTLEAEQQTQHVHEVDALTISDIALRNQKRINHARQVCAKNLMTPPSGPGGRIYNYAAKQMFYCSVPKIGCTFWIRILRFLNGFYTGNVSSPFMIDRHDVHKVDGSIIKRTGPHFWKTLPTTSFSFMFTRDPYTRILSGYIDKFFLPDFWDSYGRNVVKRYRRNPSKVSRLCGHDVTFPEYVAYLTDVEYEPHWKPIYRQCNPCFAKFDVIGKQETFIEDAKYILDSFNLTYLLDNYSHLTFVEVELRTLTTYNFKTVSILPVACQNYTLLSQRLWSAFQMNGFLREDAEMPRFSSPVDKSQFMEAVLNEHRNNPVLKETMKDQKRRALLKAYKQLSPKLMANFRKKFRWDFELFGYDYFSVDMHEP